MLVVDPIIYRILIYPRLVGGFNPSEKKIVKMGSSSPIFGVKNSKNIWVATTQQIMFLSFLSTDARCLLQQATNFTLPDLARVQEEKSYWVTVDGTVITCNFILASINLFTVQLQAICLNWRPHMFYPSRLFCGQELTYCLYFSLCAPPWLDFKGLTKSMFGGGQICPSKVTKSTLILGCLSRGRIERS